MDLLIVTCSPKGAKNLPALEKEAKEVQKTMPQSRCDTAVSPEALNDLLHNVKTKRFLFCGHGELQLDQP